MMQSDRNRGRGSQRYGDRLLHLAGECSTRISRRSVAWRYAGAVVISLAVDRDALAAGSLCHRRRLSLMRRCSFQSRFRRFSAGSVRGWFRVLTTISLADYFLIPPLYTIGLNDSKAVVGTSLFALVRSRGFGFGRARPERNPPGIERGVISARSRNSI